MRYMMLYKPGVESTAPPTPEHVAEMDAFILEMKGEGSLLATGGLQHSAKGARVRVDHGNFAVTDGPFTEAKEVVAGYAIVQAKSTESAIEMAKRFLAVVGAGETEVRLMHDGPAAEPR